MASLSLRNVMGTPLVSGQLNNFFSDVSVGGSTPGNFYVMVVNDAGVAVTTIRAWLGVDTGGITARIGLASGTATFPVAPGSYSIPTDDAGGLTLSASLAAGGYVLIGVQVDPSSGSQEWPENNVLYVAGDGPI
jgi:hypothetical protein